MAFLAAVSPSRAGTNLFDAGTSWNLPGDWSLGHVPTASDALLFNGPASTTLDNSFGVQTLSFDPGSSAVNIDANALSTGSTTTRTLTLSGGTNALGTTDLIDLSAATTGTITLGGASGAGTLNVALGTNGTFNVASASANLVFGANSTLTGAYGVTKTGAGTLTLAGVNTYTGNTTVSAGTLAITAGSVGVANSMATFTVDGAGTGASAPAASLSGGSLSTGTAYIGYNGTGTFTQSGGSFTTNGQNLFLGGNAGSSGTYTLSSGSLSTGEAYLGYNGTGTFTQSGGSVTLNGTNYIIHQDELVVGCPSGILGTYNLNGGSLSVTAGESVGSTGGTGIFTQTGGTNAISVGIGFLSVGDYAGGHGTYNLSGTGALNTPETDVGFDGGTGVFNQTGGIHSISTYGLRIGEYSSGNGTYNLNGGTLATVYVSGGSGTSTFNFNGGTLQARQIDSAGSPYQPATFFSGLTTATVQAGGAVIDTNGFNVTVAQNLVHDTTAGGAATDGGLTKIGAGTLTLGGANTYTGSTTIRAGTLAITGGSVGVANSTADFRVDGAGTGAAAAAASLSGGSLSTGQTEIGYAGTGSFIQSGGSFTTNGYFLVGYISRSSGTYTLSGTNSSLSTGQVFIGDAGTGTFTQSGGTFTTNGNTLQVGFAVNNNGIYTLSGAGSSLSTGEAFIGNRGTGTFTQSGGTFTTNGNDLYLGFNSGSSGTYNLSGAGSSLMNAGFAHIGYGGTGAFTQSGGSVNLDGLVVGQGGGGTYTLSGAGSSLSTGGAVFGSGGTGTFTQSGGTFTTNGNELYVGYVSGGTGIFTLSGAGSSLSTGPAYIGYRATGTFTQNGGTLTTIADGDVSGNLVLGYASGGSGTYNLNGGTLAPVYVSGGSGTSTFNFNGGTLQAIASDNPGAASNPTTFFSGLTTANVRAGGAVIDTNGFNVTVAQNLVHGTTAGATATDGGLTKIGAGTLTLTGSNTYTGATTINAGILLANDTNGSATGTGAVTVNGGGTLAGNGTISGAVTVANGGTLAPGALAVGRLTLGSTLTLQSGSMLAITLGGTTAGSGYDQLQAGGALTLAGTLGVRTVNGFTLAPDETFTILDGTSTALTTGTFSNAPGTLYTDAAGDTFVINYGANMDGGALPNDVTLTVINVVPEPSTWTLLGLGGVGLLGGLTLRRSHVRLG